MTTDFADYLADLLDGGHDVGQVANDIQGRDGSRCRGPFGVQFVCVDGSAVPTDTPELRGVPVPRTRRRGNPLVRIGVFLVIIGFGSAVLHSASDFGQQRFGQQAPFPQSRPDAGTGWPQR